MLEFQATICYVYELIPLFNIHKRLDVYVSLCFCKLNFTIGNSHIAFNTRLIPNGNRNCV